MTSPTQEKVSRSVYVSGIVVIALLSVSLVLLMKKNSDLREQLQGAATFNVLDELKPGDPVKSFEAQTLDGSTTTIEYSEADTKYLVLVLSTTCPYCEKNIDQWRKITGGCQQEGCYVIGVSVHDIERTRQYMVDKNVPFYTVSNTGRDFAQDYKITGVPVTILVSEGGIVEKMWPGASNDDQVEDIISAMKPVSPKSTN